MSAEAPFIQDLGVHQDLVTGLRYTAHFIKRGSVSVVEGRKFDEDFITVPEKHPVNLFRSTLPVEIGLWDEKAFKARFTRVGNL